MFQDVQLQNYRGFSHFTVSGLKRINLFVGRNNCGKTSLIEAVQILSAGDRWSLLDIAERRGEVLVDVASRDRRDDETMEVSHFFHGHYAEIGASFAIQSDSAATSLEFSLTSPRDVEPQLRLFDEEETAVVLQLDRWSRGTRATSFLPLTAMSTARRRAAHVRDRSLAAPMAPSKTRFITPDSLNSRSLTEMWQQVMVDGNEEPIVEALQLIEPGIRDIRFLPEQSYRRDRHGIVLGMKGQRGRVPLGSMGDGIRRLLALATSLSSVSEGFLFVDEIDTGLHYSILADMWRLVIETARRNAIQVFATTHSLDCLRALALVCDISPSYAGEVAVNSISQDSPVSIALTADELRAAIEHDLEVRG